MRDRIGKPVGTILLVLSIALAATSVSGCGGGGEIPADQADALTAELTELQTLIEDQDCAAADEKVNQISSGITALADDKSVDSGVRQDLKVLNDRLDVAYNNECDATETTTTTTTSTPTATTTSTTTTETDSTTTTDEQTDEEPKPEPEPEPDPGPGNSGGNGNQGGNSDGSDGSGGIGG